MIKQLNQIKGTTLGSVGLLVIVVGILIFERGTTVQYAALGLGALLSITGTIIEISKWRSNNEE